MQHMISIDLSLLVIGCFIMLQITFTRPIWLHAVFKWLKALVASLL